MTTRRELLIGAASLALVPACSGGGSAPSDAQTGPSCQSVISGNHGHVLAVQGADLTSMRDHTYDIHGSADHTHSVTITQAQLGGLATGMTVTVTSTLGGGHTHNCSVHCMG